MGKLKEKPTISGTMLNDYKGKFGKMANFDWSATNAMPETGEIYRNIWRETADMENSLGGMSTVEANGKLSRLMDYQQTLKMPRVKTKTFRTGISSPNAEAITAPQSGQFPQPEYGEKVVKGGVTAQAMRKQGDQMAKQSAIGDEAKIALRGIDDLVGTDYLNSAMKTNAIYELTRAVSPRLIRASLTYGTGALIGGTIGARQGGVGGAITGAAEGIVAGGMLQSPIGRRALLKSAFGAGAISSEALSTLPAVGVAISKPALQNYLKEKKLY
ncbi:hypothetical protein CCP1ISM_4280001 [Azospirillaceae bacterium]